MKQIQKKHNPNLIVNIGLIFLIFGLGTTVALTVAGFEVSALADSTKMLILAESTTIQGIEALGERFEIFRTKQMAPELLSMIAYVTLIGLVGRLYLVHFRSKRLNQPRYIGFLFLLLCIGLAQIIISQYIPLLYLFPTATLAILAAVLIDIPFSVLMILLMGLIVGYTANGSLPLTVYTVLGGLMGVLSLKPVADANRLLRSSLYVALSNVIVVLTFHLPGGNPDPMGLWQLMAIAVVNGFLCGGLVLIGLFLLDNLFGLTTPLRLVDLAKPSRPLLQHLLTRAPGTYHHTMMVGNLAEQAAERIGGNALLTRVGAYYHDVGKMAQPDFFIENQQPNSNHHDRLSPQDSAQIIINHVKEGLNLAKKYGLPHEVRAFIAEHHGTSLIKFFYQQALEQVDDPTLVDETDFRYPGPKPQHRETAIVMLADSCEAAVRAEQPSTAREVDQIVYQVILDKVNSGELNECQLTMHDLGQIRRIFVEILQGVFHQRIKYPPENTITHTNTNPAILSTGLKVTL